MKAKVVFVIVCLAVLSLIFAKEEEKIEENAPEIVYIHYSTPEEAELARKQILAQYEALGGTATIVHQDAATLPEPLIKEEPTSDNNDNNVNSTDTSESKS